MNETNPCHDGDRSSDIDERIHCTVCNRELDYLTALGTEGSEESIYICFESIKQRIFVYGKYTGGKYGAIHFKKYYTKGECSDKQCEKDIHEMLNSLNKEEYSRFITCTKGNMESIILTKDLIELRKADLLNEKLSRNFTSPASRKKYYCHIHAKGAGFKCSCGEELIELGSERHRELTGMKDQKFMETYLADILNL